MDYWGGGGGGGKGYVGPPFKLLGGPGPPLPTHICQVEIHYKGDKRLCKNAYSRFSQGKIGYIVKLAGRNSTIY